MQIIFTYRRHIVADLRTENRACATHNSGPLTDAVWKMNAPGNGLLTVNGFMYHYVSLVTWKTQTGPQVALDHQGGPGPVFIINVNLGRFNLLLNTVVSHS